MSRTHWPLFVNSETLPLKTLDTNSVSHLLSATALGVGTRGSGTGPAAIDGIRSVFSRPTTLPLSSQSFGDVGSSPLNFQMPPGLLSSSGRLAAT
jgi:hypothetical protein